MDNINRLVGLMVVICLLIFASWQNAILLVVNSIYLIGCLLAFLLSRQSRLIKEFLLCLGVFGVTTGTGWMIVNSENTGFRVMQLLSSLGMFLTISQFQHVSSKSLNGQDSEKD